MRRLLVLMSPLALCYLRIEWIDAGLHEHVSEDEVLEAGGTTGRPALVVVLEGLEKVCVRLLKLALAQMHLAAALPDHAQDERVWDGGLDVQGLVVQRLQLLIVLLRRVHLDL